MCFVDYSKKLGNHEEYLDILNKLEEKCKYVEIVITFESDGPKIVEQLKSDIILNEKVSKWEGTETLEKYDLYRIKSSKKLFDILKKYETFCKWVINKNNDVEQIIDYGLDDIAFFDDKIEPMLYTTAHEGYITVREDIIK